ncbi:serine/threonine kinase family protein, partial [Trifolium medium]|nr:serine/threonine kinase family protein [Trifolium medium]
MVNQAHFEYHAESFVDDPVVVSSAVNETILLQKKGGEITADGDTKNAADLTPTIALDKLGKSIHTDTHVSKQAQ